MFASALCFYYYHGDIRSVQRIFVCWHLHSGGALDVTNNTVNLSDVITKNDYIFRDTDAEKYLEKISRNRFSVRITYMEIFSLQILSCMISHPPVHYIQISSQLIAPSNVLTYPITAFSHEHPRMINIPNVITSAPFTYRQSLSYYALHLRGHKAIKQSTPASYSIATHWSDNIKKHLFVTFPNLFMVFLFVLSISAHFDR